jgi:signal peptidase I
MGADLRLGESGDKLWPTRPEEDVLTTDRKPWLAALLTLPLPGLGHLYAGLPIQALVAWLASVLASALVVMSAFWAPRPLNALLVWLIPFVSLVGIAIHAWRQAAKAPRPYALQRYNRWYVYPVFFLLAVPVLFIHRGIIQSKFVEAFRIPSRSMEPTIMAADFLFLDKRSTARRDVTRGTIVVFLSVEEAGLKVIKRVVGLPGDTLSMRSGALLLDGRPDPEDYLTEPPGTRHEEATMRAKMKTSQVAHYIGAAPDSYDPDLNNWGPLVVPPDSFFLLGDNRDQSYDSRYWGFLPSNHILGQPLFVYWSYDPWTKVPLPFFRAGRWDRFGLRLPRAGSH